MQMQSFKTNVLSVFGILLCTAQTVAAAVPSEKFDLSKWYITLPVDENSDGKVDNISVADLQGFHHPDFFYLDDNGNMVFTAPNKALTTKNSTNTRSELRQMPKGSDSRIKTQSPKNSFTVASNPLAERFASIGGKMEATLKIDHVAKRAEYPDKPPAFSVVIGQIHATKWDKKVQGFGWGNEPLKIYYKKWPEHQTGSVFWTYERNLPKTDQNRTDIAYPVWGHTWENPADPGPDGIALGEELSYTVNVHEDIMYLTFETDGQQTVKYEINLSNAMNAYGKLDELDHPYGYTLDWNYFKAGAYNQCSTSKKKGFWYPGCLGTGNWEIDKANGDYAQVSFSKLALSPGTPPEAVVDKNNEQ